jgi:sugar-specific transcriptional regulator TrmB
MDTQAILKDLGLSEQESIVYLALLKIGGSIASNIAKEVGIKRTTVYALLKSLAQKGFVTLYYRKSRQYYYAEKPQRVAKYFEKKLEAFNGLIPALEVLEKKQIQIAGLRFIETLEELKQFYAGILEEYKNKEYKIIGSASGWEDLDPEFFVQYRNDRGKNNIKTKLLLTADSKTINQRIVNPSLLRVYKYFPAKYKFKSTIDIYKDKVLIISPELSSLAVVIAVPVMTDVFKSVFEVLWDLLPEESITNSCNK